MVTWQAFGEIVSKITMRIDQAKAIAILHILHRNIVQQGGFAGSCLPDDIDRMHPVRLPDRKRPVAIAAIGIAKIDGWFSHCVSMRRVGLRH